MRRPSAVSGPRGRSPSSPGRARSRQRAATSSTSRSASRTSRRRRTSPRRESPRFVPARRTTARRRGSRSCARRRPGRLPTSRGVAIDPENVVVATGAKPFLFFTVLATCGPGDEVIYPDPGVPDLRVGGALLGRDAGAAAAPRGARLQLRPRRARGAARRADAPRDPQRSSEPDRRRHRAGRSGARRGGDRADAGLGAHRRGVLADHLRRRGSVDRVAAGAARAHRRCSTASRRRSR